VAIDTFFDAHVSVASWRWCHAASGLSVVTVWLVDAITQMQAAELLAVHQSTVAEMVQRGEHRSYGTTSCLSRRQVESLAKQRHRFRMKVSDATANLGVDPLTICPVISGRTGISPVFANAGDLNLELLESRKLDGRSQLLAYRPTAHA
jgi:excisionase family DNA binding protein